MCLLLLVSSRSNSAPAAWPSTPELPVDLVAASGMVATSLGKEALGEGLLEDEVDITRSLSVSVVAFIVASETVSTSVDGEAEPVTEESELLLLLLPLLMLLPPLPPWQRVSCSRGSAAATIGLGTIDSE